MTQVYILLVTLLLLLAVSPMVAVAQDGDDESEFQSFVQSDFNIVTGDVQRPNGIFWHEGYLYTSCAGDATLYRIEDTSGSTISYIWGVKNSHSLYVENGEENPIIWAADVDDNEFVRISRDDGGLVSIREGLAAPWGLAASMIDDTFFITELGSDNVINITREGDITVVASDFEDPTGLVATEDSLYVGNNGSATRAIEWIDLQEDASTEPQSLVSGLQNVTNLVMGPDDMLYIAYALGTRGVVGRVDPEACKANGGCNAIDVELVVWTELNAPLAGLVVTPDHRLYVHTEYGSEIYWLDLLANDIAQSTE